MNKRYVSGNIVYKDCAFCPGTTEDETHFLFYCPVYSSIRHKHIAEFMEQEGPSNLRALLETPSALVSRKVAMYVFYALKLREEILTQTNEYKLVYATQVPRMLLCWYVTICGRSEYSNFYLFTFYAFVCAYVSSPSPPPLLLPPPPPPLCMGRWPSQ